MAVAEAGPPGADAIGGYYTGSSSEGEWVAAYVSGAGELTVMAPGVSVFKISFDESGRFKTTVNDCAVDGKITGSKITASARCDDGTVNYDLSKSGDSGAGELFAGIYEQKAADSSLQALITPDGQVFFNYTGDDDYDSGKGAINSMGEFSVTSDFGGSVIGLASPGNGELRGAYTVQGEGAIDFNMQRASTGAPTPIAIEASRGTFVDRIEIDIQIPDTRRASTSGRGS